MHIAAERGHVTVIKVLAALGADVSAPTRNDSATQDFPMYDDFDNRLVPVYNAAYNGHVDAIKALVALGADVRTALFSGDTPAYIAGNLGHGSVFKALAALGADVRRQLQNDTTSFQIGALKGYVDAMERERDSTFMTSIRWVPSVYIAAYECHADNINALLLLLGRMCP
jgi:hypothetical protein